MTQPFYLSPLVLGFWRLKHWHFSVSELQALVEGAMALGITSMDHAMVYRSESRFGELLTQAPGLRDRMQLVTKCGIRPVGFGDLGAQQVNHYDASSQHTEASVEASLRALNTDRLDLLLLHRPDYLMDVHEIAETFVALHKAGKVMHFGVSNFRPAQLSALQAALPFALATHQVECSPLHLAPLDDGTFDQAVQMGFNPMLWSCLGGGRLVKPETAEGHRLLNCLQQIAASHGLEAVEPIVLAWLRRLPCQPHPILGTSQLSRVQTAAKALDINLSREEWYQILEASRGAPIP